MKWVWIPASNGDGSVWERGACRFFEKKKGRRGEKRDKRKIGEGERRDDAK